MRYAPNHVHKFNACVLLVGAVWSVFGVICAFLLPPQDDFRNLFRAIINYAISTFVIYPAELYVLHWILIPLREDLNDLINRSAGRLSKRGSLSCCAVVVFEESVCVEQGKSRESPAGCQKPEVLLRIAVAFMLKCITILGYRSVN